MARALVLPAIAIAALLAFCAGLAAAQTAAAPKIFSKWSNGRYLPVCARERGAESPQPLGAVAGGRVGSAHTVPAARVHWPPQPPGMRTFECSPSPPCLQVSSDASYNFYRLNITFNLVGARAPVLARAQQAPPGVAARCRARRPRVCRAPCQPPAHR